MKKTLQFIFVFTLLGLLVWGIYLIGQQLSGWFSSLDPGLISAIIAGFVAVFGFLYNQRQAKRREIEESHRAQKIEVYNTYLDIVERMLQASKDGELDNLDEGEIPEDLREQFQLLTRGLIVWGSPGVITKWLKAKSPNPTASAVEILLDMDELLQEVRKDLGNSNRSLNKGDLVKLFLSDPEEMDKEKRQSS